MNAIAREEEGQTAGVRIHQFDNAELLADTPELVSRTEGRSHPEPANVDAIVAVSTRRSPTCSTTTTRILGAPGADPRRAHLDRRRRCAAWRDLGVDWHYPRSSAAVPALVRHAPAGDADSRSPPMDEREHGCGGVKV